MEVPARIDSRRRAIRSRRRRSPPRDARPRQADEGLRAARGRAAEAATATSRSRRSRRTRWPASGPIAELLEAILAANRALAAALLPGWLTRCPKDARTDVRCAREIEAIPERRRAVPRRGTGPRSQRRQRRSVPPSRRSSRSSPGGTSDHAAIHLRYLIETELGIPTGLAAPSVDDAVWRRGALARWPRDRRVAERTLAGPGRRRRGGPGRRGDDDRDRQRRRLTARPAAAHVIDCRAGEERSVAATKSYVAQLAAGAALVGALAPSRALAAGLAADAGPGVGRLEASPAVIDDGARSSRSSPPPNGRSSSRAAMTFRPRSRPRSSSRRRGGCSPRAIRRPISATGRSS